MTTDNTQEIDELRRLLFKKLPNDWYYHVDVESVPQASIHREAVESMLTRILDWHNKQVEEAMAKFHLKKGVKYDVKASDSVIVITASSKQKESKDEL